MPIVRRYALPVETTEWKFEGRNEIRLSWDYGAEREHLLRLYNKGKRQQWNAATQIDWSKDLDPENPMLLDDRATVLFGSPIWERMTHKERAQLRHHQQAATLSHFLHGEQGALIAAAKIVQTVPDLDAKFYAATQVMDEARHVEVYQRLLHDKFELAYPVAPYLKAMLETGLSDRRWDMVCLTMQILIEGVALTAFQQIRKTTQHELVCSLNTYVMQDEARHVAFGQMILRDYYKNLSEAERNERAGFVVDACYLLYSGFDQREVFDQLGLPVNACVSIVNRSRSMRLFRHRLLTSLVPTIRDIGLLNLEVRQAFIAMGVTHFKEADVLEPASMKTLTDHCSAMANVVEAWADPTLAVSC